MNPVNKEKKPSALQRLLLVPAVALVLGAAPMLSGCNTVEGMGEDVEAAGDSMQDAAD